MYGEWGWMETVSYIAIAVDLACTLVVAVNIIAGRRQKMWIMNLVWPITGCTWARSASGPTGRWGGPRYLGDED